MDDLTQSLKQKLAMDKRDLAPSSAFPARASLGFGLHIAIQ